MYFQYLTELEEITGDCFANFKMHHTNTPQDITIVIVHYGNNDM
jgi:hypothetical protein